jgi:hypothetical protein
MSSVTSTCPSQVADAPMPIVGQATALVDSEASLLHHAFEDEQEGAGLGDRPGVGEDLRRLRLALPASAVAAEHVDRLRSEADMADHRDPAAAQEGDRPAIASPPSSFTAAAPVSLRIREAEAKACSGEASYEPNGMSMATSECHEPRTTAAP